VKIEGCGEKDIIPVGEGVRKLEGARLGLLQQYVFAFFPQLHFNHECGDR
jgi:hypothetical protein